VRTSHLAAAAGVPLEPITGFADGQRGRFPTSIFAGVMPWVIACFAVIRPA
jgi:hypothetical protein